MCLQVALLRGSRHPKCVLGLGPWLLCLCPTCMSPVNQQPCCRDPNPPVLFSPVGIPQPPAHCLLGTVFWRLGRRAFVLSLREVRGLLANWAVPPGCHESGRGPGSGLLSGFVPAGSRGQVGPPWACGCMDEVARSRGRVSVAVCQPVCPEPQAGGLILASLARGLWVPPPPLGYP